MIQLVNSGSTGNDGTGDTLRTSFGKINSNFTNFFTYNSLSITGDVNYTPDGRIMHRNVDFNPSTPEVVVTLNTTSASAGDFWRFYVTWSGSGSITFMDGSPTDVIASGSGDVLLLSNGTFEFVYSGTDWIKAGPSIVYSISGSSVAPAVRYGGAADGALSYTTSMSLWLLPGTASNYTDGIAIDYWLDASGNGNYAFQTSSFRPTLASGSGINNLNALRFDGDADQCMFGSSSLPSYSGVMKRTAFVVYRPNTTGKVMNVFGTFAAESVSTACSIQARDQGPAGDPYFAGYANDLAYPATTLNTGSKIAAINYDGAVLSIYRNGARASGSKTLNTTNEKYRIGSGLTAGVQGDYMYGDIAEVIAYNDSLSSASMATVFGYLKTKYNL